MRAYKVKYKMKGQAWKQTTIHASSSQEKKCKVNELI